MLKKLQRPVQLVPVFFPSKNENNAESQAIPADFVMVPILLQTHYSLYF
ncbi:hypothetical protein W04_0640 [Pseudoalteromonas sp. SW0106-04]|nr:hypothetical protein W04_0640 [Pseudoalteromonas sp. SW0106-04]